VRSKSFSEDLEFLWAGIAEIPHADPVLALRFLAMISSRQRTNQHGMTEWIGNDKISSVLHDIFGGLHLEPVYQHEEKRGNRPGWSTSVSRIWTLATRSRPLKFLFYRDRRRKVDSGINH
jgi:hypothetical protein